MNDPQAVDATIQRCRAAGGPRAFGPAVHDRSADLVTQWVRFDAAAYDAARRLEQALDAWADAAGEAPSPAEVRSARRLRFVANHRLRWILFQTRRAQATLGLL